MNFIHIKYRAKKLEDFEILNENKEELKILGIKRIMENIIFYGKHGSCKKTLLLCYLNKYFDNDNSIYNTQTIDTLLSNNYSFYYKSSIRHFEIKLLDNYYINKLIILEIVNKLIKNKSVLNDNIIIVIFNIDKLKEYSIIKYLSERKNVKILCTSNKYINISSTFIQYKIKNSNYFDLLKLSLKIKKDYKLNISNKNIKKIIFNSDNNINILLNNYQEILNNNIEGNEIELTEFNIILKIKEILLNKNINDFNEIKVLLNNLLIYQYYNIISLCELLFNNIINDIKNKYDFTKEFFEITNSCNNSNTINNIILLDTIIFSIYKYI